VLQDRGDKRPFSAAVEAVAAAEVSLVFEEKEVFPVQFDARSIHILDVTVEGSAVSALSADLYGDRLGAALGYFVAYRLPGLNFLSQSDAAKPQLVKPVGASETTQYFTVWWDAECAVLNGRNRHVFEEDRNSISVLGAGIVFDVFASDADGCFPDTPKPVASAQLSADALRAIIASPGCNDTVELPLQIHSLIASSPSLPLLRLSFAHRLQPALVRSIDGPLQPRHTSQPSGPSTMNTRSGNAEEEEEQNDSDSVTLSLFLDRISHLTLGPLHRKDVEFFCTGGIVQLGSNDRIEVRRFVTTCGRQGR
jgi:hypothetical protein